MTPLPGSHALSAILSACLSAGGEAAAAGRGAAAAGGYYGRGQTAGRLPAAGTAVRSRHALSRTRCETVPGVSDCPGSLSSARKEAFYCHFTCET